ncbi:hypothetical protein VZ94_02170 [Methylocucumis oryzae]|uniref:Cohesin domain-containing protein n=2 Tax=Methylocucumis oryzae TaxID=1632867 RepID=A0A0F3IQE1_9GAMM|nr:hypothetical protein VZ94_02170 [Methylocucumis oryzae]
MLTLNPADAHLYEEITMNKFLSTAALTLCCLFFYPAQAATLSVDMVPGAGIDSSLATTKGANFAVNIFINDVKDLAGFELELAFDNSVLAATSIVSAGLFGADTFLISDAISAGKISFAELSLAFSGNDYASDTLLATVSFKVLAAGVSQIDLLNVLLSDANGDVIQPLTLHAGHVTATDIGIVPLPGVAWLFGSGLLGLARLARKN